MAKKRATRNTANSTATTNTRRGRGRTQGHGQHGTAHVSSQTVSPLQFATPEQRKTFYSDMRALREAEFQFMRLSREMGCGR